MKLNFIKCHGSSNEFILIDERKMKTGFPEVSRSEFAREVCSQKSETNADGVLFILESETADAKMRIFNADGSEAEMCGNGLRCVARALFEEMGENRARVQTMKAIYETCKHGDIFENIPTFGVIINTIEFQSQLIPVNVKTEAIERASFPEFYPGHTFSAINLTNPHLVCEMEYRNTELLHAVGAQANVQSELFPQGINVSFVTALEENTIFVETFERGVGPTNACGTAMCAATALLSKFNEIEKNHKIEVFNPGGMVFCKAHFEHNCPISVELIGNATKEFGGSLTFNFNLNKIERVEIETVHSEEAENYGRFLDYCNKRTANFNATLPTDE